MGLAEAGAAVAILARDEEKSQATLKELLALGVPALALEVDLKQRRELKPAFDEVERRLGPVDIMVNNAAYATLTSVVDTSEEDWDGVLAVNLNAAFLFCKYAAQSMIKRGERRQDYQRHQSRLGVSAAESFRPTRLPRAVSRSLPARSRSSLRRIISRSTRWRPDGSRPT